MKKLKIVGLILLSMFNLFVCFTGVYAWFTFNTKNDASNVQVQVGSYNIDVAHKVYKWDEDSKEIIDATDLDDALTLQKYDSIIKSRNVNTSILLEFTISGASLQDNSPILIKSYCTDDTLTNRVISNIIRFQFSPISIVSTDANDIYYQAIDYFDSNQIPEVRFKTNSAKLQVVDYSLTNYSNYITQQGLKLFIRVDYCEELIDAFEFTTLDSTTTTFTNDLVRIDCITDE